MTDMMHDTDLLDAASSLIARCKAKGEMIATAESCTGGLITGTLTGVDGSSSVVDCGFVTYSNEAKHHLIGVGNDLLAEYGAVSEPVARAMCEGALDRAPNATIAVSVTGIAGPQEPTPNRSDWFILAVRPRGAIPSRPTRSFPVIVTPCARQRSSRPLP